MFRASSFLPSCHLIPTTKRLILVTHRPTAGRWHSPDIVEIKLERYHNLSSKVDKVDPGFRCVSGFYVFSIYKSDALRLLTNPIMAAIWTWVIRLARVGTP